MLVLKRDDEVYGVFQGMTDLVDGLRKAFPRKIVVMTFCRDDQNGGTDSLDELLSDDVIELAYSTEWQWIEVYIRGVKLTIKPVDSESILDNLNMWLDS